MHYVFIRIGRVLIVDDVTKAFWCFFRFTVPIVVHLQNANAKFRKVA